MQGGRYKGGEQGLQRGAQSSMRAGGPAPSDAPTKGVIKGVSKGSNVVTTSRTGSRSATAAGPRVGSRGTAWGWAAGPPVARWPCGPNAWQMERPATALEWASGGPTPTSPPHPTPHHTHTHTCWWQHSQSGLPPPGVHKRPAGPRPTHPGRWQAARPCVPCQQGGVPGRAVPAGYPGTHASSASSGPPPRHR